MKELAEHSWTEWPDGKGFDGFYWTKQTDTSKPELVHIGNAKDGHALEAWQCPGIGRYYFDHITARRFLALPDPVRSAIDQALAIQRGEVIDECAKVCDARGRQLTNDGLRSEGGLCGYLALELRALKG